MSGGMLLSLELQWFGNLGFADSRQYPLPNYGIFCKADLGWMGRSRQWCLSRSKTLDPTTASPLTYLADNMFAWMARQLFGRLRQAVEWQYAFLSTSDDRLDQIGAVDELMWRGISTRFDT